MMDVTRGLRRLLSFAFTALLFYLELSGSSLAAPTAAQAAGSLIGEWVGAPCRFVVQEDDGRNVAGDCSTPQGLHHAFRLARTAPDRLEGTVTRIAPSGCRVSEPMSMHIEDQNTADYSLPPWHGCGLNGVGAANAALIQRARPVVPSGVALSQETSLSLPETLHFCAAHCYTFVLKDGRYEGKPGGAFNGTITVEKFTRNAVVLNRIDPPNQWFPQGLRATMYGCHHMVTISRMGGFSGRSVSQVITTCFSRGVERLIHFLETTISCRRWSCTFVQHIA